MEQLRKQKKTGADAEKGAVQGRKAKPEAEKETVQDRKLKPEAEKKTVQDRKLKPKAEKETLQDRKRKSGAEKETSRGRQTNIKSEKGTAEGGAAGLMELSTNELAKVLKHANYSDFAAYANRYLQEEEPSFSAYMALLLKRRKMKRQEVFQKADIPQKYGYKLLSGEIHTTDRDRILRLLIGMNLTLKEAQRALTLYGLPVLYPKRKRDAVFMIAFNQGADSIETVNDWLIEEGEPPLARMRDV